MIVQKFDPHLPYVFVFYGRMSNPKQNQRSPDQQWNECERGLAQRRYPWRHLCDYVDKGITGRRLRTRKNFWRMITDIRSGKIKVDLIVVDTLERLGRSEELESLRRELRVKYGVLVVTADTGFADPGSVTGRVHATVENLRASEEGRVKAHNVLRGKRDAVLLKHWPGGPPPFGYSLEQIITEKHGRKEVDYSILVPERLTDWIILRAYTIAAEKSWGSTRVTQALNADPEIPDEYKPFVDPTVWRWLGDSIYIGIFEWGDVCTDIVSDSRVVKKNDRSEILRVEDFCKPIVPVPIWNIVQEVRNARRARRLACKAPRDAEEKLIAPIAPGLALKYILSGLIRCEDCERSMTPMVSKEYTLADGTKKRYVSYRCPGATSGACPNRCTIPEAWLRQQVIELLQRRLFTA